jgi:SAM-dependent methyltransferase
LQTQVALSWDEEERILRRTGADDAKTILEVGPAAGYVTERLLHAFPSACITGLEVRADLLDAARGRLGQQPRVSFVEGSILDPPFAPQSFDLVLVRLVLQHLVDPAAAVRCCAELLAPGGALVLIDVDAELLGVSEPRSPELAPIYRRAESLQSSRGGSRLIGRRLWRLLQQAGLHDIRHEAFLYHSDTLGISAFADQLTPQRLLPALHAGVITREEYELAESHYWRFLLDADPFVLMLGFAGSGRKS